MSHTSSAISLIIAAHNPCWKLVRLVSSLHEAGFRNIIVVNDGSSASCRAVFEQITRYAQLLEHAVHLGKGAALKTAFAHVDHGQQGWAITLESNGRHQLAQIQQFASLALQTPRTTVLLGVSSHPLAYHCVADAGRSQAYGALSGLCSIPTEMLPALVHLQGTQDDYEWNMLAYLLQQQVALQKMPPRLSPPDSTDETGTPGLVSTGSASWLARLQALSRDITLAALSLVLDLLLFAFALHFSGNIPVATVLARMGSATFNFTGNRLFVFRGQHAHRMHTQLAGYIVLAVCIMLISAFSVEAVVEHFGTPPVITKIGVDSILYVVSFLVRQQLLFRLRPARH